MTQKGREKLIKVFKVGSVILAVLMIIGYIFSAFQP